MTSKYHIFSQYPSVLSVLSVLKSAKYSALPEVEELLNIYSKVEKNNEDSGQKDDRKHPLVVLEGLDGCGKSHTSKLVSQKLNASLRSTPPPSITSLRPKFDAHDSLLRRAYYALGNYVAADEIKQVLQKQPVVLDRFWHSTSAYGMANELIKNADLKLPDEDNDIYFWPRDLMKPDLVIFLTLSESVRLQRLSKRKSFTVEEDELKNNKQFRDLLNTIFKNFKKPELLFVDNSQKTVHESSDDIVNIIKELPVYKKS